jgi:hypothetical protein
MDLESVTCRFAVDLEYFLDDCALVDRRSAEGAEQWCTFFLRVLDEVVVASLVELVGFIALKLTDLHLVVHILVAQGALATLRSIHSNIDCACEALPS